MTIFFFNAKNAIQNISKVDNYVNDFQIVFYGEFTVWFLFYICASEFTYLTKGRENAGYCEYWIICR